MRHFTIFLTLTLSFGATSFAQSPPPVFTLHSANEPHNLDPALNSSLEASYIYFNLFRGLYSVDGKNQLQPEGAKGCNWKNALKLVCEISENQKWSDGKKVEASEYINAFHALFKKEANPAGRELLVRLKNSKAILKGLQPVSSLGVNENSGQLVFDFKDPDPEFLWKLASPLLVPIRKEGFPAKSKAANEGFYNGPFKVASWKPGKRLRLTPNSFYSNSPTAVQVEFLFLEDDEAALNLYQSGELSFLRRLQTMNIREFKGKPDFYQLPVARFDYFGFGPELKPKLKLREALIYSLDYNQWEKLLDARGRPGCTGLQKEWFDTEICLNFDLKRAKAAISKVAKSDLIHHLSLYYSISGGDDHKKSAEWMQAQWKKHLGLEVDIHPLETAQLLAKAKKGKLDIFRKGLGLLRPSCMAGLENFSENSPENLVQFRSSEFEKLIASLEKEKNEKSRARLCTKATHELLDSNLLIPTGRIHFTMLANPHFKGWTVNYLNQLDLGHLQYTE